jgi:prepilin-type N-terminal cleavage/methylation domain-containing protein
MKQTVKTTFGKDGFTLIEAIAVLVILGVMAAVVAVKMSGTSAYDLASQVEAVKGHLRYAQTRAMNENLVAWGINFNSATTYYLFQGAGSTTPVQLPGEDSTTINLTAKNSGLTITPVRITFNEFGSPCAATGTPPAPLTADATVTTSGGTITITRNTGFIP